MDSAPLSVFISPPASYSQFALGADFEELAEFGNLDFSVAKTMIIVMILVVGVAAPESFVHGLHPVWGNEIVMEVLPGDQAHQRAIDLATKAPPIAAHNPTTEIRPLSLRGLNRYRGRGAMV